jgi:hypothetical protein
LGIFEIGFHFFCLYWPQTMILLISASQARIIGVSHQSPTPGHQPFFLIF